MRILSLILVVGLVLGIASYSAADSLDTDWIPGPAVGVVEIAVPATKVLTP